MELGHRSMSIVWISEWESHCVDLFKWGREDAALTIGQMDVPSVAMLRRFVRASEHWSLQRLPHLTTKWVDVLSII